MCVVCGDMIAQGEKLSATTTTTMHQDMERKEKPLGRHSACLVRYYQSYWPVAHIVTRRNQFPLPAMLRLGLRPVACRAAEHYQLRVTARDAHRATKRDFFHPANPGISNAAARSGCKNLNKLGLLPAYLHRAESHPLIPYYTTCR